jgi:HlyD family secretion protein
MKKSWLLLLLPVVLLIWWGLSRRDSAVVVHISPVARMTIESIISTNGKVEPAEWAAARTLSPGIVDTVSVERGEAVKAGQPLVTLDARLIQAELSGALARKQEAQVEISTLSQGGKAATLASLNDSLRAAKESVASLQRNYDSLQRLLPQQAATKMQVDDAKDALERAKLQVASIEHQRDTLVTASDKSAALARVNDAQSVVDQAAQRLQYGVIRAPISGTLYQFDLKKGAYLQAGDLVGLVGNLERVKVVVYVDEPDLGRVSLGMPVSISWDAQPGRKWAGKVDKLPSQVIALGTRTVGEVTTIVENPNHDLLPGVTVNATIISRVVKNATSVPKAALRSLRGENGVYKVVGDRLRWTPVKAGASDISNVEILSGVSDGDKVAERVVEPSDAELMDGLRVKAEATP